MAQAWDKLPNETNKAYTAFRQYLMLGGDRSLVKVQKKTGFSHAAIDMWSAKNNWVDRVTQYEQDQVRLFVGDSMDLVRVNQENVLTDMLNDYQAMLAWWRTEVKKYADNPTIMTKDGVELPSSVDPRQMRNFFEARRAIDDMARRAIGLPAQNPIIRDEEKRELPPEDRPIKFLGIPQSSREQFTDNGEE